MIEIVILGRGGQGGVTLAKLIAMTYFLQGQDAQAFGVYAAERSGAPLRAFVRADSREILCRNQITEPDHLVVLDRTLITDHIASGLKPGGWIVLNSPDPPAVFADEFPGYRIATIDANSIAIACGLGTRTTPIVNTTILGATARVLGETFETVQAALEELKFVGPNLQSARRAYETVFVAETPSGTYSGRSSARSVVTTLSILDPDAGIPPQTQTGSWARQKPLQRSFTSPCNQGCPAGNDVRGFLAAVKEKNLDLALEILHRTSPLPGVCGRVCPAPCMEACHRNELDEPVNIRELERYIADHATGAAVPAVKRDHDVAVVGSGPAGLAAAYHLGRLGYRVTIFEAGSELGGVMRTGIPEYRLPRLVLDREIAHILDVGITAQTRCKVGKPELLKFSQRFSAVFVATGLQEARALSLGIQDSSHIMQGIAFLDEALTGNLSLKGERVIVLGGGNTAVDAARTAIRLGASEVSIVYRRTRAEMPAIKEEVDEALEEGVSLQELLGPVALNRDGNGRDWSLACQRMRLGEPDQSGRRSPMAIEGEAVHVALPCDRVILALGQLGDLSLFPEGSQVREGETLIGLTGAPIFAGGDLASNEGTVAAAIGSGRKAAWHIHRSLSGEDLFPKETAPVVSAATIRLTAFEKASQSRGSLLDPAGRIRTFEEVRTGLDDSSDHEIAVLESQRCFTCGACTGCDICRANCPEGVLTRRGTDYAFDYDYCKGCGLCAFECPRGVILMEQL